MSLLIKKILQKIKDIETVEDLSDKITNYNTAITYKNLILKRQGHVYFLDAEISQTVDWKSSDILFTIPKQYLAEQSVNCTVTGGANTRKQDVVISATNGNVVIGGDTSNSVWLRIVAVWIR